MRALAVAARSLKFVTERFSTWENGEAHSSSGADLQPPIDGHKWIAVVPYAATIRYIHVGQKAQKSQSEFVGARFIAPDRLEIRAQ
jgi:hypothetical protein